MEAICARHPERLTDATCARCGDFACELCTEGGKLCPACRDRVGFAAETPFPFDRNTWTIGGVMDHAWQVFSRNWGPLTVASLIFFGASMALGVVDQVVNVLAQMTREPAVFVVTFGLMLIVRNVVQGIVQMGFVRIVLDVLEGKPADIARIASQAGKVVRYILQVVCVILVAVVPMGILGGLLFGVGFAASQASGGNVPPAVVIGLAAAFALGALAVLWFLIPLYFVMLLIVHDDDMGVIESIQGAFVLAKGQRLPLVGLAILTGLIMLAGMLACCVGVIPAFAFATTIQCSTYLALRKGSELERR